MINDFSPCLFRQVNHPWCTFIFHVAHYLLIILFKVLFENNSEDLIIVTLNVCASVCVLHSVCKDDREDWYHCKENELEFLISDVLIKLM